MLLPLPFRSLQKIATSKYQKDVESKLGNADDKARQIIDDALKTAEAKRRESLLEVKEESIRTKNELDKEIKDRRAEVQRYERRIQQKEENIDKKSDAIEEEGSKHYRERRGTGKAEKRNCQLKRAKSRGTGTNLRIDL